MFSLLRGLDDFFFWEDDLFYTFSIDYYLTLPVSIGLSAYYVII
jgi:hypothetical protein